MLHICAGRLWRCVFTVTYKGVDTGSVRGVRPTPSILGCVKITLLKHTKQAFDSIANNTEVLSCINMNSFCLQRNVWLFQICLKVPDEQKETQESFMFKFLTLPLAEIKVTKYNKLDCCLSCFN